MFKSYFNSTSLPFAIAMALIGSSAAYGDAEVCNFPFGKPQKKMVEGKPVPALENKGQLLVIAEPNSTLAMLVFDKKQDQVRITLDGKPGTAEQKSGNLVVLDGRQIKNANQIVINVTKDEVTPSYNKSGKESETFQYVLIRLEPNAVGTEKGRALVTEQTRQCGAYFQTYYPPLEDLPVVKTQTETSFFKSKSDKTQN